MLQPSAFVGGKDGPRLQDWISQAKRGENANWKFLTNALDVQVGGQDYDTFLWFYWQYAWRDTRYVGSDGWSFLDK